MLYRILLFSVKHKHESAIGIPMSPPSWWIGFDWNDECYYNSHNIYSSRLPLSSLSDLNPGRVRTSWSCICRGRRCFRKGHMAPNIIDSSSPLGCFHVGDGGSWLNILPFLGPHLSENLSGSYCDPVILLAHTFGGGIRYIICTK